jgi:hypothetical protein
MGSEHDQPLASYLVIPLAESGRNLNQGGACGASAGVAELSTACYLYGCFTFRHLSELTKVLAKALL